MDNRNENELETEFEDINANTDTSEEITVIDEGAEGNNDSISEGDPSQTVPSHAKKTSNGPRIFVESIFDIFEMFAICTAVILLMFSYVARLTVVEGASMEDTLHENDYMIVQSIGYTPTKGDIVVIQKISSRDFPRPIIKRVIATEGDTVDIDFATWTVYVNGKAIDEPYTNLEGPPSIPDMRYLQFPLTVEEGKIFVLGDHRNHSADSRYDVIGQIDESCVVGRAVLRVMPFDKFGIMERAKYE